MRKFFAQLSKLSDVTFDALGIGYVGDRDCSPEGENDFILDVPMYRQVHSYTCGAVAGLMVVRSFYSRSSDTEFFDKCNLSEEGTTTRNLVKALRGSNVGVKIEHGLSFKQVKKRLEDGYPLITCLKHSPGIEHWVVIFGYCSSPEALYIAGTGPAYLRKRSSRLFVWKDFRSKLGGEKEFLVCWGTK
jgi:hypothetical protein